MNAARIAPPALLAALLAATPGGVAAPAPAQNAPKPNVLVIVADDLNHWVGHLGRNKQVIPPNIGRLAARGVAFANAHTAAPVCNPSRAAFMSGLRPSTTGVYDNGVDWRPHIAPDKTLVTHFRRNGYTTLGAGKIYHGIFDRQEEWDEYGTERRKHHWRKFSLWEESTRAPLIWVAPGVTRAGTTSNRTVDFMSIYPTLSELCGLPIPAHVTEPSIRKLLADPSASWDRPAVTTHEYGNHAVRSAKWRYIRYQDGGEELYDAAKDPYEWTNLANDPKYVVVKAELARFFPKVNTPQAQPSR